MVNLNRRVAVAVGGAVAAAAAVVAAAAPAFADTPDPQVVQIDVAKACGTITVTLDNRDSGEYGFIWTTVPGNGGSAGIRSGLIVVASNNVVQQTIRFDEDSYDGVGAFTLGVVYGPNTHKQQFIDVYPVDTDCQPPTSSTPTATATATPTPTATPTASATPTATASPSVTPAPRYRDCAAARAAGAAPIRAGEPGYRAALDADGDGIACEDVEGRIPTGIDTGRA